MRVLFVCLGNTCRSPMAEAVLRHLIRKKQLTDWHTDSAGLRDWNVGLLAQGRAQDLLKQHGLKTNHLSRMITEQDFYNFDYIFGMDESNILELENMASQLRPPPECNIQLLGSYIDRPEDKIIRDPYFSEGMGSFHTVYVQILESCERFVLQHGNSP